MKYRIGLLFMSLATTWLGWHSYILETRISRALELLSDSNDEIVKPARLYAVLSGETFRPFQAHQLTEEDQAKDDAQKLKDLPNGGIPTHDQP